MWIWSSDCRVLRQISPVFDKAVNFMEVCFDILLQHFVLLCPPPRYGHKFLPFFL